MSKPSNLQSSFLNKLRKNKHTVTLFTTNGVRMTGHIVGFDQFAVVMSVDGTPQMVYKHAISTLSPAKPFSWTEADMEAAKGGSQDGED